MAQLTPQQIADMARKAGFPESEIPTAVAVALAESGGVSNAMGEVNKDGTRDFGLFQLNNKYQKEKLARITWSDPQQNANEAFKIWKEWKGWGAWAAYNSGSYKEKLPQAQKVAQGTNAGWFGLPDLPNIPNPITPAIDLIRFSTTIAKTISDRTFWIRVGLALLGLWIIWTIIMWEARKQTLRVGGALIGVTPAGTAGRTAANVAVKKAAQARATSEAGKRAAAAAAAKAAKSTPAPTPKGN